LAGPQKGGGRKKKFHRQKRGRGGGESSFVDLPRLRIGNQKGQVKLKIEEGGGSPGRGKKEREKTMRSKQA